MSGDRAPVQRQRWAEIRHVLARPSAGVIALLIFYLAIIVMFSILSPYFLVFRNLMNIGTNVAFIGLMAAAGTPLIIAGGLDLSVAAIAGLSGVAVALLHAAGLNIWLASVVALFLGGGIGYFNGLMTTGLRLNPLIVTLGTMSIVTGISLVLTGGLTKPLVVSGFDFIGGGRIFGVPFPLILMVVFFACLWWVFANTRFGRYTYASGGNAEASRLAGVPVQRTQIALYVLSGVSGAIGGVVLASMLGAAAPDAAGKQLLTIIAAIILGGTSLYGGRGSVWGTLLAVLLLGTLNNGLTLMNVSSFWQDVTRGVVLLLAVSFDQLRARRDA